MWASCDSFMFVAAMNPCPCGYYGDERKECTCSIGHVQRYQGRISGPLMDRIDIHVDVRRVPFEKLAGLAGRESWATIRARVETARKVQAERFKAWGKSHVFVNGDMGPAEVQHFCELDEEGKNLMCAAVRQMDLSARAYHRVLKLGRTIADLAGEKKFEVAHLAEASQSHPRGVM